MIRRVESETDHERGGALTGIDTARDVAVLPADARHALNSLVRPTW